MKHVIRYLPEGDGSVPKFVESGGYFKSGEELVGISVDQSKRHLPSTVIKMTKVELQTWIQTNAKNRNNESLSEEETLNTLNSFLQLHGLENYE